MRKAKALSLSAFLWFAGCASFTWEYTDKLPSGIDGRTTCSSGKPFIEIRPGMPERWHDMVFEHEKVHVKQALKEKDCLTFLRKYAWNVRYRLNVEAQAFCQSTMPVAKDQKVVQNLITVTLLQNYGTGLAPTEVDSVVRRWCLPEIRPGL